VDRHPLTIVYDFQLLQEAALAIKKQFGKNALLKGVGFSEGATAKERNQQIGGHHA